MTVQEATKRLNILKALLWTDADKKNKHSIDLAIQALEEVEQYRALGTVEELKEAREKQIPKKVTRRYMKNINGDVIATSCYCPICDEYLQEEYPEYCSNCGQALKCGEEDV